MTVAKRNVFLYGVQGRTGDERGVKAVRGEAAVVALLAAIERYERALRLN